ncbi:MAG: hypothetical protein ACR5LF_11150 [Symbiopectobacterium sp.]
MLYQLIEYTTQNLGVKTAQRTLDLQLTAFGTVATDEHGIETLSTLAN